MGKRTNDPGWKMPTGECGEALTASDQTAYFCGEQTTGIYWQVMMVAKIRMLLTYRKKMIRQDDIDRADRTIQHFQSQLFQA